MDKEIHYKAFKKDMTCRGFQYEEGKEYEISEPIKICERGFHACKNPLDCFEFYDPSDSVLHEVIQSGKMETDGVKTVSSKIKIGKRLSLRDIIVEAVRFNREDACEHEDVRELLKKRGCIGSARSDNQTTWTPVNDDAIIRTCGNYDISAVSGGKYGRSKTTGARSIAASTSASGVSYTDGNFSVAATTGSCSASYANGLKTISVAAGLTTISAADGIRCISAATSDESISSVVGDNSISGTTSGSSMSFAEKAGSVSVATGRDGVAITNGNATVSVTTSDYGNSSSKGSYTISGATGEKGSACANKGRRGISCVTGTFGESVIDSSRGISAATGDFAESLAKGYGNVAVNTGWNSRSIASTPTSIAIAWGYHGTAQGVLGSYLVFAEWDNPDKLFPDEADLHMINLKNARMIRVDNEMYKENVLYTMRDGEIVEAKA